MKKQNQMKLGLTVTTSLLLIVLTANCDALIGEEVARLPINKISTSDEDLTLKKASLDLVAGEKIAFWSEMDMEYEGEIELRFRVEIIKDGEYYSNLEIDPTDKNITLGEFKAKVMDKTDWSFTGKNSEITFQESGNYTFSAFLAASENETLVLTKAELVIKM